MRYEIRSGLRSVSPDYKGRTSRIARLMLWLMLLLLVVPQGCKAGSDNGRKAEAFRVHLGVDVSNTLGVVSRADLGVGFIRGPFEDSFGQLWDGTFDGTSARIWVTPAKSGRVSSPNLASTRNALDFACQLGIAERNGFAAGVVKISRRARYASPDENNLDPVHQPDQVAEIVARLSPEEGAKDSGTCGLNGWEVWNEPQFEKKGKWPAKDLARYAVDVAKAIHAVRPEIRVGAPLYERDMDWNRQFLSELKRLGPREIDFVVFHPYWFGWWREVENFGSHQARVAGSEVLRAISIRPKVDLVREVAGNDWRIVASEWNVHPKGYRPPYDVSTDLTAALHFAGIVNVFMEEGVGSAQFFQLRNPRFGHFGLAYWNGERHVYNATGKAMVLYGRYLRGQRLKVDIDTPSFSYPAPTGPVVSVPWVFGIAVYDIDSGRVAIFVGNRDADRDAMVALRVSGLDPGEWVVRQLVLSSRELNDVNAIAEELVGHWAGATVTQQELRMPAKSIAVLLATRSEPSGPSQ